MTRGGSSTILPILTCVLIGFSLAACGGSSGGGTPTPGPGGGTGPFALTGLTSDGFMTIESVALTADSRLKVTYELNDAGTPLAVGDLDRDPRFILAHIETDAMTGYTRYQAYTTRTVNGAVWPQGGSNPPALASATQVTHDSGGTLDDLGGGRYCYTFATQLPPGFDAAATHTLATYAHKDGRSVVANPYVHFVPSGAALTTLRETATTASCETCHNGRLEFHGGVRNEYTLCQVCHTDQSIDPETGNSVEMGLMIHKIHYGADLANGYTVVGFGQRPHDYSNVHFPQDVRNCTVCHTGGSTPNLWAEAPSRSDCDACHDDIDWVTGTGHQAGAQANDNACAACHGDTQMSEFDISVPGSHVIEYESLANPNLDFTITAVTNMTPGNQPSVTFSAMDKNGAVDITTLNRVAMVFGGPHPDYKEYTSITIVGFGAQGVLVDNGGGSYTFTPETAPMTPYVIPAMASGTWSVGMEARTNSIPVGPNMTGVSFGANNPVVHIDLADGTLGGGSPDTRRVIVDEAQCATCHGDIVIHGNLRTDFDYCYICHNARKTDEGRRPMSDPVLNPPESVDFRYMIHKIHRGADLDNGYVVWGFGPTEHIYSDLLYTGDLRNCSACHVGDSEKLPIPSDAISQVFSFMGVTLPAQGSVRPPTTATCLSCHDSDSALAHAITNMVIPDPVNDPDDWLEACASCHGPGAAFDAEEAHK
ncbi:MAG: OmcA/MtrC family decaheme c-type cytochrome [Planctomycetota bacterium]|nr:OmcA/MtrC family decaheme c-type cytochrome [Planctomycetota bacterium]